MDPVRLAGVAPAGPRGKSHVARGNGGWTMNIVNLLQPARIVFGNGCAVQSVEYLVQRGAKRVLLVTDESVRPNLAFLFDTLQQAGCSVVESGFVNAEPTLAFFNSALQNARAGK